MDGSWLFTPLLWWHYILMVGSLAFVSMFLRNVAKRVMEDIDEPNQPKNRQR